MSHIIQFLSLLLPFLKRKTPQEITEFTDLIKNQYTYLMEVIEKFQKDYFELSDLVKSMNQEIITLNVQLKEALKLQCKDSSCNNRL